MLICKNINCFNLTKEQLVKLQNILPAKETYISETDFMTDIIAVPSFASFINISSASQDELTILFEYCTAIEFFSETIIFLGDYKLPLELKGKIITGIDLEKDQEKVKFLLLNAYRKSKNTASFSNTVFLAIKILSEIRRHPGVTTATLSEMMEISPRTVQRYIETLRVASEDISYDKRLKGWRLTFGKSVLWGDFDNYELKEEDYINEARRDFTEY